MHAQHPRLATCLSVAGSYLPILWLPLVGASSSNNHVRADLCFTHAGKTSAQLLGWRFSGLLGGAGIMDRSLRILFVKQYRFFEVNKWNAIDHIWFQSFSTRKRHIAWCNSRRIGFLDRGRLLKEQRASCIVKSAIKKTKSDGKVSYTGSKFLKGTQSYPIAFGLRILRYLPQLWSSASSPPSPPWQDAASLFAATPFLDTWKEAKLLDACIYLRGSQHLRPTQRWKNVFPEKIWDE